MSKVVKKLKAIRRAIKNIPAKNINLDKWVTKDSPWSYKKCIMCPAAWIATDVFLCDGLRLEDVGSFKQIKYKGETDFEALAKFTGLNVNEAEDLFGPKFISDSGPGQKDLNHKRIFLDRIDHLIETYS